MVSLDLDAPSIGPARAAGAGQPVRVAIVGCGPKGLYGLERLLAEAAVRPGVVVELDVVDRSGRFGAGDVYHPDQPSWLLANVPAGAIDAWPSATAGGAPPVVADRLALVPWLRRRGHAGIDEASTVARADVGRYLEDCVAAVVAHAPANVTVRLHRGEVVDVGGPPSRHVVVRGRAGEQVLPGGYDHVLLATGHPTLRPSPQQEAWRALAADRGGVVHVPAVYPVERLDVLPPQAPVGVLGTGLTFVDLALACSLGRGGRFEHRATGTTYRPSGREPVLLPFSRRGLPMIPRPLDRPPSPPLAFCTHAAVRAARDRSPDGLVDLDAEVLPLLWREMRWAHARVLLGLPPDDPPSSAALDRLLTRHHDRYPGAPRFRLRALLDPLADDPPRDVATYERRVRAWLAAMLEEGRRGEEGSPLLAASAVWRSASAVVRAAVADGGATPDSHRRFLRLHHPRLARTAFGPPLVSGERLLALVDAGVVRFVVGPDGTATVGRDRFVLDSSLPDARREVAALVDARIAPTDVSLDASSLVARLRARGELAAHEVRGRGQAPYRTGGVALVPGSGQLCDVDGRPVPGLAATGTPTEGPRYDNDALRRDRNDVVTAWAAEVVAGAAAGAPGGVRVTDARA